MNKKYRVSLMDFEQARFNMIEQQIRTWDVLDLGVLDLISNVHREDFIPDEYKSLALADTEIPIGHEQMALSPKLEARIVQALQLQPNEEVLEIGTGCGYLTALMAKSAKHVRSVELYDDLSQSAANKLEKNDISNVELISGDIFEQLPEANRYDAIVITGAVPFMIDAFTAALKPGGRLFAVVGSSPIMEAMLYNKLEDGNCREQALFETELAQLINAPQKPAFRF